MDSPYVQQFPRTDGETSKQSVLVGVVHRGPGDLDLDLEGTEGSTPYVGRLSSKRLADYLSKGSPVDLQEWKAILSQAFLRNTAVESKHPASEPTSIEVTAQISGDDLLLAFRKNTAGIHQRVGELRLRRDEEHELDTIAWVMAATRLNHKLDAEVASLRAENARQADSLARLDGQLVELCATKDRHDEAVLEKMAALLNAKKLKIRDQLVLLASSRLDPARVASVMATRNVVQGGRARASRLQKRKLSRSGSGSSGSGFERMETGKAAGRPLQQSDGGSMQSSRAQSSVGSEDDVDAANDDASSVGIDVGEESDDRARRMGSRKHEIKARGAGEPQTEAGSTKLDDFPARRALPFGKSRQRGMDAREAEARQPSAEVMTPAADPDDELTEDEL